MRAILTLAAKDLRVLFRDRFGVFWIFVFPLLYAMFFGAIFGGSGGGRVRNAMRIAVVDEAGNAESTAFLARLAAHKAVRIDTDPETGSLRQLDPDAARDAVRRGTHAAYLRIRNGFGEGGFEMFSGQGGRLLEVGIDPSRRAEAGYLQGILMQTTFQGFTDRFRDPAAMKKQVARSKALIERASDLEAAQKNALTTFLDALDSFATRADVAGLGNSPRDMTGALIQTVNIARDSSGKPRSSFDVMFPSAILWGLIGCMAGFAISIVRERTEGTLLRLRVAPVTRAQVLAGKALACLVTCLAVAVFLLAIGHIGLGVRLGSVPLLALALVCTGLCFTGIMMTVSVMGKTEQAVAGAGWGVMMPLAMVGGAMVPLMFMPPWLLTLSHVSPVKWGIYAIEGAIWRDFSAAEMAIPCGILLAMGAAFFGLGVWIFRRTDP